MAATRLPDLQEPILGQVNTLQTHPNPEIKIFGVTSNNGPWSDRKTTFMGWSPDLRPDLTLNIRDTVAKLLVSARYHEICRDSRKSGPFRPDLDVQLDEFRRKYYTYAPLFLRVFEMTPAQFEQAVSATYTGSTQDYSALFRQRVQASYFYVLSRVMNNPNLGSAERNPKNVMDVTSGGVLTLVQDLQYHLGYILNSSHTPVYVNYDPMNYAAARVVDRALVINESDQQWYQDLIHNSTAIDFASL